MSNPIFEQLLRGGWSYRDSLTPAEVASIVAEALASDDNGLNSAMIEEAANKVLENHEITNSVGELSKMFEKHDGKFIHITNSQNGVVELIKFDPSLINHTVTSCGKNLFNIDGDVDIDLTTGEKRSGYVTVENGILTSQLYSSNYHPNGQVLHNMLGKTISISANVISSDKVGWIGIYENGRETVHKTGNGAIKIEGYVCQTDTPILGLTTAGTSGGAQFTDIQVEIGETATNFEAYVSSTATVTSTDDSYSLKTYPGQTNIYNDCGASMTVMVSKFMGAYNDVVSSIVNEAFNYRYFEQIYGFIEHEDILAPASRIEYTDTNASFTPMTLKGDGSFDYGGWSNFQLLLDNKPYMVRSNGVADYELNPDDYTKKLDGSDSDVANAEYDGGAFSWIRKIYKKEWKDGNDRHVQFSFTKYPGFEAVGFKTSATEELPGIWLPMFYGSIDETGKMRSISGTQPVYNKNSTQEKTAIDNVGSRARFFGGSIVNTLNDLMTMFIKSTNCDIVGRGNQSGYNGNLAPTYGVLENAVVGGGQFYGTTDGKSLNKLFHSIVLGSYQQWQRDPYTLGVDGIIKVSPYYECDMNGVGYVDTGAPAAHETAGWKYPSNYKVVKDYGIVPVFPYGGSTSLGACDGMYLPTPYTGVRVSLRFGSCPDGSNAGLRALSLYYTAGFARWSFGASVILLPPA